MFNLAYRLIRKDVIIFIVIIFQINFTNIYIYLNFFNENFIYLLIIFDMSIFKLQSVRKQNLIC